MLPSLEAKLQSPTASAEGQQQQEELLSQEILCSSTEENKNRARLLENEIKILKSEFQRIKHEDNHE